MLTTKSCQDFLSYLSSNGASPETIRAYGADLRAAHGWLGEPEQAIEQLTWKQLHDHLYLYLAARRNVWAPKTIQRHLGTLRSWSKWAGCPFPFLGSYRPPTPAKPQPHPIPEGIPGVMAMIKSTRNPRHKALCALTGFLGLRVEEAVNVRPQHFNTVEMTLRVMGKGSKERDVPVSPAVWAVIEKAYRLAERDGTTLVGLTNGGARKAIARHGRNAGLSRPISSHDMRATLATAAYETSKDLRAVQELLGHADSKTTQVYTGVSMNSMRAAAAVI